MPLSLFCDEHVPFQVVEGLRRRGVTVTTVQQMGLRGATDASLLGLANQQGHVVYTNDADFLRLHSQGVHHAGIIYHHTLTYSIGEAIRLVALACEVLTMDEMQNRVEFL